MKFLMFIIIATSFSQLSFAQSYNLEPIYSVEFIEVDNFSTEPICPINSLCKRNGTIVNLEFELSCDQKVKSFDYKSVSNGIVTELVMSIVTLSKTIPGQPRCLSHQFITKKIYLENTYGEVVITNLGTKK